MVAELPAFCGWLPHPEHWLRIAEPVALFHRIGWLCHPGIIKEEGITQKELAGQIGVSLPYVNRITRGREQLVNKTFLKMMDELGYDVELTYKKKAAD